MEYIFSNSFIKNDEITFYICVIVLILICIFAFIATYKEIEKNDSK